MYFFEEDQFIEANIEITNACNFNCWFCPRHSMTRKIGFMDFEDFKKMIMNFHEVKVVNEIWIAGIGEPTLHPRLIDMINFIKDNTDFIVTLTTNGAMFKDDSYVEKIYKTGVELVTISFRITDPVKNRDSLPKIFDYDEYIDSIIRFVKTKYDKKYNDTEIELAILKDNLYSKYILDLKSEDFINKKSLNKFMEKLSTAIDSDLPSYENYIDKMTSKINTVHRVSPREGLIFRFDGLSAWTTANEKFDEEEKIYPAKYGSCLGMKTHIGVFWNGDVSTCCADYNVNNLLGNIFEEKDIYKILTSKKSLKWADSLKNKKMPTKTCQICRGGKSRKEKFANVVGSIIYQ